eukprot:SAG31_NODE_26609_length_439_cov_1.058824_1_plen_27_part_01
MGQVGKAILTLCEDQVDSGAVALKRTI